MAEGGASCGSLLKLENSFFRMISRWTFESESGLRRKFCLWQGAISTGLGLISPSITTSHMGLKRRERKR